MRAADILAAVRAAGITLKAEGEGIRATPRAALTDSLRAEIRANRAAILAALREDGEAQEERAAILEFDGGLTREIAERLAGICSRTIH